ncbi:hypothetical protein ACM46_10095 [Chryseobacterium angstadtii]|uniref:Knr4/Smi1-like domain-containing protein n=1 Tax=Chryseobacterium angstadtii TaxID=558151 RepID=A0A0J7IEP6_9FLAO|nr:hypothetical protein [Chryseobacterium angstadtii]KMQ64597.1 hypothetical protein ACM46_10095 [Chryseobacterium angstadtii]
MIDITEFKENLGLAEIPVELEKLIYFQNNISSYENYSQGFGVTIDDKLGLKSWSEDKNFLARLFPIAQANGSGSFYTIWNDGTDKALNQMPIVVFGDEDGVHIVAENILQLLHLLTYDTEISIEFDTVYFYRDEDDYEESEDLHEYLKWMAGDYHLSQIEEPDELIKTAQDKYKEPFEQWFGQYFGY